MLDLNSDLTIVTVTSPNCEILKRKTEDINIEESDLKEAKKIGEKLKLALTPYFPAAGLAAPQIGISRSVFIYSYNREPENLEIVINPSFSPIGDQKVEGWEGCFSIILSDRIWRVAKIVRHEKIHATYLNEKGETVKKTLEGFAAKVFQHEYDHLQGIVTIERKGATVKDFDSKEEMMQFLQNVKREDTKNYKNS